MANTFADISFINFDQFTNAPAARLVSVKGKIWDQTNSEMVSAPTYADTLLTATGGVVVDDAVINGVRVHIPLLVPTGTYHLMFYDAAAPDNTTAYARWYTISWNSLSREITSIRDMGPMA